MWLALLGCQEPFGADRHDLVGFRIAALSAAPAEAGETVTPRLALIVDGRPWSTEPVDLAWHWARDADAALALDADAAPAAVGPAPALRVPADRRTLALVTRHGDEERRAVLEIARPPATVGAIEGFAIERLPLRLDRIEGPELLLDAREALAGEPADTVDPGGFLRIRAEVDGDPLVRWMATAGTFFELDRSTTDWAAGDVHLDEDALDGPPEALAPGPVTLLALALGAPGETTFRATELHVGEPGPGLWVAGRWLPTDQGVGPAEAVRGTLRADDRSPVGLALADPVAIPLADAGDFGTPALRCALPRAGPFDPGWLLEAVCARDDVAGAPVVVVPDVRP